MTLKRIDINIDELLLKNFKELPGTLTEHIRQAMYDYLKKINESNISSSRSERGD